jgi:hypothetical protein
MTALDAATAYTRRGWSVIPVPTRSKNPGFPGWEQTRLAEPDLVHHFNGKPQNIGLLLGEPSGWLVDVDLDHARCVERADEFLPPTPAVFGRPGKPRSHRIYRVTAPVATRKFRSKSAGMLVELRSTGAQTVIPPGMHESGEPIAWEAEGAEPVEVDGAELLAAVQRLAEAVKVDLGEKAPRRAKAEKTSDPTKRVRSPKKFEQCVAAMLRMEMTDHNDGSARLYAAACRIVEHDLSDKDAIAAVRDYARQRPFPRDWTDQEILARVRDAEQKAQRGVIRRPDSASRPNILIDTDEHRVVDEAVKALAADPELFQRGNALVRVLRELGVVDGVKRSGSAVIVGLPTASLRERLTKFATFTKMAKRGDVLEEVPAHPTAWLVSAVDSRGRWPGIRPLNGLSDTPVLRPDGTLCQAPGYDPHTGVLYEPEADFPPVDPGVALDDADASVEALKEVVCDFRFESPEHQAAWFAALLTPLGRFAFDGPSPMFLIDANVRGAGKGLLAQTIGQIALGREMPVSSYAHDSEEMRKKITAIALAGDRLVHLDNLEGNFGNDTLDRALTTTRWKDRILGKSQQVDLPLTAVWYGTGNNVAVAADTTRRIIHIRLDVLEEKPEDRTGFRHPDLIGWLRKNRGLLLSHALTILVAYCNAGKPDQRLTPFGSFEGWSNLVRQAVVWAGLPDPCLTRTRLAETSDLTSESLGRLMEAWKAYDTSGRGVVISDLLARLYPAQREFSPSDAESVQLRVALEQFVGGLPGRVPSARQVGNKLRSYRRRVIDGAYLDTNPQDCARGGAIWRLHHV